jgi:hypothetical protein
MKKLYIKVLAGAALMSLFLLAACSDLLEEQPRSIYEPGYFKTEKGIQGGLTALYAHLRDMYGQGYHFTASQMPTDEGTWGQNSNSNQKDIDFTGVGTITPSTSRSDVVWNATFPYINTANGIIENAEEVGTIPDALIAEARFFRAYDYFLLVQLFGGVPLDLGSGELAFNISTVRTSVRNTVPEVYTRVVFPDLLTAVNDLPETGRVTGGVTKTAARLVLAKAYLTYGWWLENPGDIPTYPECPRTDPDGHNAQWYFQQAYDVATTAISNPGPFGLQPTFYDANLGQNDRNSEILLYADHTESSEYYTGGSLSWANGGAPENFTGWFVQWNYTEIRSNASPDWSGASVSSVQREAVQDYGRPWTSVAFPLKVFTHTFADKTNDSRYDGTFVTVYRGNWPKGGVGNEVLYNANGLPVRPGDAILTFLPEEPAESIDYSNSKYASNVGAGILPGRADYVVAPSGISRIIYPGVWKLIGYRTDNGDGLGSPNGNSIRPYNILKFSELYLVAAEAAVMGAAPQAGQSARDLVNVLRARAGKWRWDHAGNVEKTADYSAEMIAATPAAIDIDYILAERSREFFSEGYRWNDLVRTQKLIELAGTYEICGPGKGDHTPQTFTRDLRKEHYLRPIPQGQIDGVEMSVDEKRAYQNPGYN